MIMADYRFKTADNQQDIILRRRRRAIAVYEKDRVTTIEAGQRLHANRFLNNLKKSETLLKEHESTKTTLFMRRNERRIDKELTPSPRNDTDVPECRKKRPSSCPGRKFSDEKPRRKSQSDGEKNPRIFSAKLKEINKSFDVPYVKLSSYTKDDLKRPATALELKRKVWEKLNDYLEKNSEVRLGTNVSVERCAANVPRNVQLAREKLHAFTNVRFLSQLPPAPPRVDVQQAQCQRRELEKIEGTIVKEFCDSLNPLKTVLPESFGWMDVSEVYSKNAEVQRQVRHSSPKIKEREKSARMMAWIPKDEEAHTNIRRGGSRRPFHHRHSHPFDKY